MCEDLELTRKKRTMMKTNNAGFILMLIVLISADITYDTSNIFRLVLHILATILVIYLVYRTIFINIEFISLLKEEKEELRFFEGNLIFNMISLLIAVIFSYIVLNDNIANTYSVSFLIILPLLMMFPIFRTYKRVLKLNLYKSESSALQN